jgi:hypothetical protein
MSDSQYITGEVDAILPSTAIAQLTDDQRQELGIIVNEHEFAVPDVEEPEFFPYIFQVLLTAEQVERLNRLCDDHQCNEHQYVANVLGANLAARIGRPTISAPSVLSNQELSGGTITAPSGKGLVTRG